MTRALTLVLSLCLSTAAFAQFDALTMSFGPIERIGDSDIANSFVTVHNSSYLDVPNVFVRVNLTNSYVPETTYIGGQNDELWTCQNDQTPFRLVCSAPLIPAGQSVRLQLYVGPIKPESRVTLSGNAIWQWYEAQPFSETVTQTRSFGREVVVTSSGDSGPGSLRAAIEYANDACTRDAVPCRIVFRIDAPVPERGWFTILPNTPLPAITASPDLEIDGSSQTLFSGDTNPLGPEIALDGSALGHGHGLQIGGIGIAVVRNLAIGGFPWNGIAVTRDSFSRSIISESYIGTDATGTQALPNGDRGITFDLPASEFDVTDNIISGNGRSGVFVAGGYSVTLDGNKIGTDVTGQPLPNGAAGVLIGPEASSVLLRRNTIAHNTKFGVAIAPETKRFELVDNSITRNGFIGIDRGLDGFSGYDSDESDVDRAKIPPPHVESATFNPAANWTTIVGTYNNSYDDYGTWNITLYRNTVNDGQGEAVLGHIAAFNGRFTLTVPGDLRGQFITATGQRRMFLGLSGDWYWTSEFSEAIEVR
jgi:Right handed beta helix region